MLPYLGVLAWRALVLVATLRGGFAVAVAAVGEDPWTRAPLPVLVVLALFAWAGTEAWARRGGEGWLRDRLRMTHAVGLTLAGTLAAVVELCWMLAW